MGTPWYTSDDLIAAVKRKISFPVSQVTFTNNDILSFANEEMFIAQVPSVLLYHEEYFVTYKVMPLQTNLNIYPIPNRATGMKLRDLFWQDQNGNLFEMTRIEEHDKAFYQMNGGSNQAIHTFYVQGNDVVLTPGVVNSPTGSLVFVFFLRPNQLVKNDRAAIIQSFGQNIQINNSLINPLDTLTINLNPSYVDTFPFNSVPNELILNPRFLNAPIYTAVNTLGGTITAITSYSQDQTQVTSAGHQLTSGQAVVISGSNSNPIIDGTYQIQVIDANNFIIPYSILVPGTAGTFTSPNQFMIGVDNTTTAASLSAAINATSTLSFYTNQSGSIISAAASTNLITLQFSNIFTMITTSNIYGFIIPSKSMQINFQSLPSTYTDSETNISGPLFVNNTLIDFLQTEPGHKIYLYDIIIPNTGISGTTITFPIHSLLVPTGTVNNVGINPAINIGSTVQLTLANLKVGDYICLANESIIPYIPPDLHNGLAERTSARILAALGDQAGLQTANAKIAEIEQRQGNLLDNRSEGTPQKVVNRHSMMRYGKMGITRRV
jgi:hypothetical protein